MFNKLKSLVLSSCLLIGCATSVRYVPATVGSSTPTVEDITVCKPITLLTTVVDSTGWVVSPGYCGGKHYTSTGPTKILSVNGKASKVGGEVTFVVDVVSDNFTIAARVVSLSSPTEDPIPWTTYSDVRTKRIIVKGNAKPGYTDVMLQITAYTDTTLGILGQAQ